MLIHSSYLSLLLVYVSINDFRCCTPASGTRFARSVGAKLRLRFCNSTLLYLTVAMRRTVRLHWGAQYQRAHDTELQLVDIGHVGEEVEAQRHNRCLRN